MIPLTVEKKQINCNLREFIEKQISSIMFKPIKHNLFTGFMVSSGILHLQFP